MKILERDLSLLGGLQFRNALFFLWQQHKDIRNPVALREPKPGAKQRQPSDAWLGKGVVQWESLTIW